MKKKIQTSITLSPVGDQARIKLAMKLGISRNDVIELALRRLANIEGVTLDTSNDQPEEIELVGAGSN